MVKPRWTNSSRRKHQVLTLEIRARNTCSRQKNCPMYVQNSISKCTCFFAVTFERRSVENSNKNYAFPLLPGMHRPFFQNYQSWLGHKAEPPLIPNMYCCLNPPQRHRPPPGKVSPLKDAQLIVQKDKGCKTRVRPPSSQLVIKYKLLTRISLVIVPPTWPRHEFII